MPRRTTQTMPYDPTPQDNFLLVGSRDDDYGLFVSRILDVITRKYNPETDWFFPDGTATDENGRIEAQPSARYFVKSDAIPFEFVLPAGNPGDTFTLYSETPNVFVRDANLNLVTDVIPLSVLHLLYTGTSWVNFSEQAAGATNLLISRGIVTSSGFAGVGQGLLVNLAIDRTITVNGNYIYYPLGANSDLNIIRVNLTARPQPRHIAGYFMNLGVMRGVVTSHPRVSRVNGTFVDLDVKRGTT